MRLDPLTFVGFLFGRHFSLMIWEKSHDVFWWHSALPQFLSCLLSPPDPSNFEVSSLCEWGLPECGQRTRVTLLKKTCSSLPRSYQMAVALSWWWLFTPTSPLCSDFVPMELVPVISMPCHMSVYIQLPCRVGKTLCPWTYQSPLELVTSPSPFPWGKRCGMNIPFAAEHSTESYSLHID